MYRIGVILGTRPEAIKLAPVVHALRLDSSDFEVELIATCQHGNLFTSACKDLDIWPDWFLQANQSSHPDIFMADVLVRLDRLMTSGDVAAPYDLVLVQGDTTTALAGALFAYYRQWPVGHVEAGLRTYNTAFPWPEEVHRRAISLIAKLHFVPTTVAMDNLQNERVNGAAFLTGNTIVDAMQLMGVNPPSDDSVSARSVVITVHRRENHGAPLRGIVDAVRSYAEARQDLVFKWVMHPNPAIYDALKGEAFPRNVTVVEPLPYKEFLPLLASASLVMTDSGGVQEEAAALNVPTVILRRTTDRIESVRVKAAILAGSDRDSIHNAANRLLGQRNRVDTRKIYGDGQASRCIVKAIKDFLYETHLSDQTAKRTR